MWEYLVKLFDTYHMRSVSVKVTEHDEVFYSTLVDAFVGFNVGLDEFVLTIKMVINENGGTIENWYIYSNSVAQFNVSLETQTIELVLKNGLRLEFDILGEKEDDEYGED